MTIDNSKLMTPEARLTEQLASDIAWTKCAAEEIRLRLMVAQNLKQTTKAKNENLELEIRSDARLN